jgi:hypothetical protein
VQGVTLYNPGGVPVRFAVLEGSLSALAREHYGSRVFEVQVSLANVLLQLLMQQCASLHRSCCCHAQNPTGVVGPGAQLTLRVIFRPLEASIYRVTLAIAFEKAAANGVAQSRRLSLSGPMPAAPSGSPGRLQLQQSNNEGLPASASDAAAALAAAVAGDSETSGDGADGFLLLSLSGCGYVAQQSSTGLVPVPPLLDPAVLLGAPLNVAAGAPTYVEAMVRMLLVWWA